MLQNVIDAHCKDVQIGVLLNGQTIIGTVQVLVSL